MRVARPALAALTLTLFLGGCAATYTAIAKRDLDVQTRMSETIFLDPVPPEERTIYVEIRNTSDRPEFAIAPQVEQALTARGYRVVDDPRAATYLLQANVLQVAASSDTAAEKVYGSPFGGPLVGAAVGGGTGYIIGRSGGGSDLLLATGGVLVGAALEGISSAFIQDVVFTVVTDVQVSEREPAPAIQQQQETSIKQGAGTTVTQSSGSATDLQRYRTRIVSTAQKMNLSWDEAADPLAEGVARSLAGLF